MNVYRVNLVLVTRLTVDVASNDDNSPHRGPEDKSEGEVTDIEGGPADPTAAGLSTLEQLKMSEEEQREFDAFSLSSVSVLSSSKRRWRALGDSRDSQSHPRTIPMFARLALRLQPRRNRLSLLILITDQSNFIQIRDKSSFVPG